MHAEVLQLECNVKGDKSIFCCHGKKPPRQLQPDKHCHAADSDAQRPTSHFTLRGLISNYTATAEQPGRTSPLLIWS